ncbi:MAG: hypothetical protein U1F98_16555 [Verrucomicrobiota bacterium]
MRIAPYERAAGNNPLAYPDLAAIIIHRPAGGGRQWKDNKVTSRRRSNPAIARLMCRWSSAMSPRSSEADHVLNEPWQGFSTNALFTLKKCLTSPSNHRQRPEPQIILSPRRSEMLE